MRANDRINIAALGSKGSFQKELEVAMPGEVGSGDISVVSIWTKVPLFLIRIQDNE